MCRQLGLCVYMHVCAEEMVVGGGKNAGLEQCELFWIRTSAVQSKMSWRCMLLCVCVCESKNYNVRFDIYRVYINFFDRLG